MSTNCEPDSKALRVLLICPSSESRDAIESALKEVELGEVIHLTEYPPLGDISALLSHCQICFLDASSEASIALRLLARIARENISVIILHPRPTAELILECVRRGASHVMTFPGEKGQLQFVLDYIEARRYYGSQPASLPGAVYGVMAGKGASGSTTTALHVATRLAEARPRKTLLVDLDGISGSIAFLLRQTPIFSVVDLAANLTRIDEDLLKKMVVGVGALDALFAPAKPVSLQISVNNFLSIIEFWRSVYDCVILDLPSCYSEFSIALARNTDLLMLVTTCELSAIHSTVRTISYLEQCGVRSTETKVVLNRYRPSELPSKSLDAALGHRVFAHVCEAGKVLQRAELDGAPVSPTSAYASDIAAIARRLTGWPIASPRKNPKKLRLTHLLRKLGAVRIHPQCEFLSIRPAAPER
jgi:pilus assembly protein CpaE